MKKIFIVFIASVFLMTGCELNRLPETTLTDSAYWKTANDLRGACNRLYNQLDGFNHDTRSDELVKGSSDAISSGNLSVPAEDTTNWRNPYRKIYVSNNIIDKSKNAEVTEAVRNRWIAEAYFFRAYNYFVLTQKYGGVPLILKSFDSTTDPEITKGQNTQEEVIAQCYADLTFAAQWLPTRATLPSADWGRVTRSSALALTARIGLYMGTLTKYHNLGGNSKDHLKKAIDASELVMKEGHSLYPDFQKLFYFEGEGAQNKENIFVKVYGPNGAGTVVHGNSRQMENLVSVTRQMIDQFLYTDGLPREKSPLTPKVETSFNSALENRDPRLGMSIYKIGEAAYKAAYVPFANQHGYGYSLKKGFILSEWETNSRETVDKMLIRYGEVLLNYAEALYEYNGTITDAQLDLTINALRKRVNFNVMLTNAFVTTNGLDMLAEIRRERIAELLDEGFHYNDIIRWKTAEKVLLNNMIGGKFVDSETTVTRSNLKSRLTDANGMVNGKFVYNQSDMYVIELAESRQFSPKNYLYPIPLNEIALTGGNLVQNPGW